MKKRNSKQSVQKFVWATVVESFLANKFTESRVLRAGVIYNIMRGLQIHNTCPLPCKSPTKSHDGMSHTYDDCTKWYFPNHKTHFLHCEILPNVPLHII